jgi:hypothetical protein
MRMCQITFHSASLTPLSTAMSGNRSIRASGTRHQVGPAGPIIAPSTNAPSRMATDAGIHQSRRAATGTAGAATATVGVFTLGPTC